MRKMTMLILLLLLAIRAAAQNDPLVAAFKSPPASAKPQTWWHWINGNTSIQGIIADLRAMKEAGIGGAQIFNVDNGLPDGPVPVMSPTWRTHIAAAIREAGRLGLKITVHNCPGWSSSGGPWIKPEHAMQMLVWSEQTVHGPASVDVVLRQPPTREGYYRDIAVYALPVPEDAAAAAYRIPDVRAKAAYDRPPNRDPQLDPNAPPGIPLDRVVDLSSRMDASGHLTWQAPAGTWVILRMGHTCTGAHNAPAPATGRGLEVDKLSREAMDEFWGGFMQVVVDQAGPLAGKVLYNALIDSYEVGYQNWTPRFREEFVKRRGYDPLPYLPVVTGRVLGSQEQSERFLWDFRRTVADLYTDNYYGYFAELCHKHGLKMSCEPYGNGPFDNLECGGVADIPMGEFWVPNGGAGETLKLAASAAHTYGHRIAGAESFTAGEDVSGWKEDPYAIKALGDFAFCSGINRYIFHRYAHQPWINLYPGMTMGPWGTQIERTVTWWDQAHAWLTYVARCQHLLQEGKFVADLCYFEGEAGPNDLPGRPALRPAVPPGYDYDGCDVRVLLNRMSVKGGRIVLPDGMSYRVLVLPESTFMTPQVARKIRSLVAAGAVVVGPRPERSPSLSGYPSCDAEVARIGREVWGDCDGRTVTVHRFGKGRVYWGRPLERVLQELGAGPDFNFRTAGGGRVLYIHRRIGTAEVYFVSNQQYRPVAVDCRFRVTGRQPELWHPDTGVVEDAPVWRADHGYTTVSLRMDPAGSVFVVFRRPPRGEHLVSVIRRGPGEAAKPAERITILSARYEAQDGSRGADVTSVVARMVAEGNREIPATNETFGDPVPLVVKRLRVEYTLNGKAMEAVVPEGGTVMLGNAVQVPPQPDWTARVEPSGALDVIPWRPGRYILQTAQGRIRTVTSKAGAAELNVRGPWTVRFKPGWGAPPKAEFPKLASWTDNADPGIRYFSGWAVYTKRVYVPPAMVGEGKTVVLDLGLVKNFAEVTLNGRSLGVLWKAPFQVDATGLLKPGWNTLAVKVTNLWPNRLIGDEQLPPDVEWRGNAIASWPAWVWSGKPRPKTGRYTFTTWHFYRKDSPLFESGLIGPVVIRSAQVVRVR
ncbi:MAG: glycosyl hydrolase [Chthonomonadales bacterium]